MAEIVILYDLKDKNATQRTQILRKLYGYKDQSNYSYNYDREGILKKMSIEKTKKTALYIKNQKDAKKVTKILKELEINFEIGKL
jgi:hypothetical protein